MATESPTAPPPRWIAAVQANAQGQVTGTVTAFTDGVTAAEVSRGLGVYRSHVDRFPPGYRIATAEGQATGQRRALVARDYPAARICRATDGTVAYLCAPCLDVYERVVFRPEDISEIPLELRGAPIACTYHLDPSRAPMPYAEAAQLAAELEADEKAAGRKPMSLAAELYVPGGGDNGAGASENTDTDKEIL